MPHMIQNFLAQLSWGMGQYEGHILTVRQSLNERTQVRKALVKSQRARQPVSHHRPLIVLRYRTYRGCLAGENGCAHGVGCRIALDQSVTSANRTRVVSIARPYPAAW